MSSLGGDMPFKKIKDFKEWNDPNPCKSPNHNPPTMIVLQPGTYEWECPDCHFTQTVVVKANFSLKQPEYRHLYDYTRTMKRIQVRRPDMSLDKDGWPKRWSDPTYLGDGPWGA